MYLRQKSFQVLVKLHKRNFFSFRAKYFKNRFYVLKELLQNKINIIRINEYSYR